MRRPEWRDGEMESGCLPTLVVLATGFIIFRLKNQAYEQSTRLASALPRVLNTSHEYTLKKKREREREQEKR